MSAKRFYSVTLVRPWLPNMFFNFSIRNNKKWWDFFFLYNSVTFRGRRIIERKIQKTFFSSPCGLRRSQVFRGTRLLSLSLARGGCWPGKGALRWRLGKRQMGTKLVIDLERDLVVVYIHDIRHYSTPMDPYAVWFGSFYGCKTWDVTYFSKE